jgi:hypothetical protein
MGFDDGPDSLALGVVQVLRGEAQACGKLLLAANPLSELVVGFHCSGLTMSPVAVQQTGRLMGKRPALPGGGAGPPTAERVAAATPPTPG